MRKLLRIVGIVLVLSSLVLKILYNHNFDSYYFLHTTNTIIGIAGLVIIIYPLISKLENNLPASFQLYPKQWLVSSAKLMSVMLLMCGIYLIIMISGEHLNDRFVAYQISKQPEVVVGIVDGEVKQEILGRYGKSYQRYKVLRYTVEDKAYYLRARIDNHEKVKAGAREMIRYLKGDPGFAMVESQQH